MKLYVFDSCPYCVRVRMLAALKNIPLEIVTFPLGQWPEEVAEKIEKTTVPMLEMHEPATGESRFIQDSTEILMILDGMNGAPMLDGYQSSQALQNWFDDVKGTTSALCYPRMPFLSLPELSSEKALAMFSGMIEGKLGVTLEQALAKTGEYTSVVAEHLQTLADVLQAETLVNGERAVSMDDIHAFPELRNLMMVAELELPKALLRYMDYLSAQTGITLYVKVNAEGALI
ncbi:glutaredoxin 2 [Parendozoicomonas haliclonae]|uniref:Glutaredoxin-2 n=2 Tax=Parendozoicomonas haliclonae TaxID=1960125 RepID=A0A1X7AQ12_9GAMM|nr:Glutaredoxin-2 [Parendozoicomonas haliclonae]